MKDTVTTLFDKKFEELDYMFKSLIKDKSNDILKKSRQNFPIGTIRNGYKKIAEGKWRVIGYGGMISDKKKTFQEHIADRNEHLGKDDNNSKNELNRKNIILDQMYDRLKENVNKDYSDSEVLNKENVIEKSLQSKFEYLDDMFKSLTRDKSEDYLEKAGKRAFIGEVRTYGGKKYVKHSDGWVYIAKDGSVTVYSGKIAVTHARIGGDSHRTHALKYLDKETGVVEEEPKKEVKTKFKRTSPIFDEKFAALDEKLDTLSEKVVEKVVFPKSTKDLKTVSILGGSSEVKLKKDDDGNYWAIKPERSGKADSVKHLENEKLADDIYTALGFKTPLSKIIIGESGFEKVSKYISGTKQLGSVTGLAKVEAFDEIRKGFVLDCLLGNWDVIGASKDNILVDKDGEVHRIDNGGSLTFRARGGKKLESDFGAEVKELKTFIDGTNPITQEIYGIIGNTQILSQIDEILKNRDKVIQTVEDSLLSRSDTNKMINLLNSRIDYLQKVRPNYDIPAIAEAVEKPEFDKSKYASLESQEYAKRLESLEFEGNKGFKEALVKQIKRVEENNNNRYTNFAKKRGISVDEYKGLLQKHVEKLMNESEYFRATAINVLDKILVEHGRFKSQFEVESSHGLYDPSGRSKVEHQFFGFKHDVDHDKDKRPIYGYCSSNSNGVNNRSGEIPPASNASHYGEVTVKIKKSSALKKATVTFEDSLGKVDSMSASPAALPHFTSLNMNSAADPLEIENTCKRSSYTEIQYHNQLTFNDIESVHMSPNDDSSYRPERTFENINKMIEIGRKTDVPIIIFSKK